MLNQRIKILLQPNSLLIQLLIGCGVGIALGLAGQRFSSLVILEGLVATSLIYATLRRPELALIGILVATSSILFEDQMPRISFGISVHLSDILLLGLMGMIIVRAMVESNFKIVRTPVDWPLFLFLLVTVVSTLIAVYQSAVEAELARRSIRVLAYYLTFFAVTNLIRDPKQLNFFLGCILLIAIVVAGAMVLQFILGDSVQLLPGRVEALVTQDALYEDITRILPPGWSTVMLSFVVLLCVFVLERSQLMKWFSLALLFLLGLALVLTFLRSYWAALIAVCSLLVYLFRGQDRVRFLSGLLTILFFGALVMLIVYIDPESRAARLVNASADRLGTLGESETFEGQDSSLNWRIIENEYAYTAIAENPLIGLGMGTPYRPLDSRLDYRNADGTTTDGRSFIHNGHLRILLQSGFLGYFCLIWISLHFLSRGFKYWRDVTNDRMKAVVLGSLLVYLTIIIAAYANSTFMQWRWTPLLGIMFGVNEVIYRLYSVKDISKEMIKAG